MNIADVHEQHPGACLLDYFAGQALQGMMAYPGDPSSGSWNNNASCEAVARTAFDLAQAMVVESTRRRQALPQPQTGGGEA